MVKTITMDYEEYLSDIEKAKVSQNFDTLYDLREKLRQINNDGFNLIEYIVKNEIFHSLYKQHLDYKLFTLVQIVEKFNPDFNYDEKVKKYYEEENGS